MNCLSNFPYSKFTQRHGVALSRCAGSALLFTRSRGSIANLCGFYYCTNNAFDAERRLSIKELQLGDSPNWNFIENRRSVQDKPAVK
jgi:hypothetical protein